MPVIEELRGREILDSRGRPTVEAACRLRGGRTVRASVPSGASTGAAEALELRDGDPFRYGGLGCRQAAANVNGEIAAALVGQDIDSQQQLDGNLLGLDGTRSKARLGANAILAVSIAFARALAELDGVPLYRYFARLTGTEPRTLPRLTINLFSGGKHAGKQIPVQDVLVVPVSTRSIDESLAMMYAVYQSAAELVRRRYGMRPLVADEGGLAPDFETAESMIECAVAAIHQSGLVPGVDAAIALDVASTHFYADGRYGLGSEPLTAEAMIERVAGWARKYPIVSIEDALSEDDWEHWPLLRRALEGRALTLGDDLLCTDAQRTRRAVEARACDALLLKVNQAGTLTEAAETYRIAREAGWMVTVSVRSGETEDDWAADLAVGWRADQFKNGSITRSERLAKYNRLLAIEAETGWPLVRWPREL